MPTFIGALVPGNICANALTPVNPSSIFFFYLSGLNSFHTVIYVICGSEWVFTRLYYTQ
ncbi:hypothetical protein CROQUDRAFT_659757 [Cronartium quercuum f. sp. fusiforme G11]|uniref:Uncharacterized protein n=1 Tax=Cronartium quercuum f. sp. fusiforme G11 TaxID=708437 RepID=A0A9P6TAF3_9BASI|nr:hypothetical protein CROQUDRAFT_659757 [Cronartium quercuum f. sp. fusiforme G11]